MSEQKVLGTEVNFPVLVGTSKCDPETEVCLSNGACSTCGESLNVTKFE